MLLLFSPSHYLPPPPQKKECITFRAQMPRLQTCFCYFLKKVTLIFLPEFFQKVLQGKTFFSIGKSVSILSLSTQLNIVIVCKEKLSCMFFKELI